MDLPLRFMQPSQENENYFMFINMLLSFVTLLVILTVISSCFFIIYYILCKTIRSFRDKKTDQKNEIRPLIV